MFECVSYEHVLRFLAYTNTYHEAAYTRSPYMHVCMQWLNVLVTMMMRKHWKIQNVFLFQRKNKIKKKYQKKNVECLKEAREHVVVVVVVLYSMRWKKKNWNRWWSCKFNMWKGAAVAERKFSAREEIENMEKNKSMLDVDDDDDDK